MIPALAARVTVTKIWKSRLGPALAVSLLALVVVGSLAWQIKSLRSELRSEIIVSADLRTQNSIMKADIVELKSKIEEQNRRIQQLRTEAVAAENRAETAALRASVPKETWDAINTAPSGPQEMNRWFSDLLSP